MAYEPKLPPDVTDPDLQRVVDWAKEELAAIALDGAALNSLELRVVHAEPSKPREGMIVEADGTDWDPGDGAGQYSFRGGVWVRQHAAGDTFTLANDITDEGALAYLDEVALSDMADLANQRVIGRNTAGAGVPEALTIAQVLAWLGNTRGDVLRRGASSWEALALGASGTSLKSDGTDAVWADNVDVQTFTSSGTWNKPDGAVFVLVLMWGPGGSGAARSTTGNASGGGGGARVWRLMLASELGSSETYTQGAAGAGVSGNANGNAGTLSTFGSHLTAYPGGPGFNTPAGGGPIGGFGGGWTPTSTGIEALAGTTATVDAETHNSGAPGGGVTTGNTLSPGGDSVDGGAGGGSAKGGAQELGGTAHGSGGDGGDGNGSGDGQDGSAPGGGGGASITGTSGDGGAGQLIVISWR